MKDDQPDVWLCTDRVTVMGPVCEKMTERVWFQSGVYSTGGGQTGVGGGTHRIWIVEEESGEEKDKEGDEGTTDERVPRISDRSPTWLRKTWKRYWSISWIWWDDHRSGHRWTTRRPKRSWLHSCLIKFVESGLRFLVCTETHRHRHTLTLSLFNSAFIADNMHDNSIQDTIYTSLQTDMYEFLLFVFESVCVFLFNLKVCI